MPADRPLAAALAEAATAAGLAPSVHNTQPWRWQVREDALDLYADRSRQLAVADPDARMLLLSCGAALHHARVALAAEGWRVDVTRMPEPDQPDHLARLVPVQRTPVTAAAMRLFQATEVRHTDRRAVVDVPVPARAMDAVRAAAEAEGVHLHVVRPDQVADLAAAVARAEALAVADPAQRAETARWVGGSREGGLGVPGEAIPSHPPQTAVPARDFGQPGSLEPGAGHDRSAVYGVLFGAGDHAADWLCAGEALSAAWLTAAEQGLSVMPSSSVVEVPGTREVLRRILAGLGQPYVVLRFGVADPEHAGAPRTRRLPPEQVVDTSAVRPEPPAPGSSR
jgi:nitroreductase